MNETQVQFIEGRNGSVDLAILVRNIKMRRKPGARMHYMIANSEAVLPARVDCDGVAIQPKMVLKVYCKPRGYQRKIVLNKILANRARKDIRKLLPEAK
jgi:hypothetical protein